MKPVSFSVELLLRSFEQNILVTVHSGIVCSIWTW